MIAINAQPEPYSSLDALRRANDEMVASLPEEASRSAGVEGMAVEARKMEFIRRAVETGAVLDLPADRKVAQSLIDYWMPSTYAKSPDSDAKQPLSAREETLLKPFDEALIRPVAERSDAVVQELDRDGSALSRRILLRLVRFSDGTSLSSPKIRETLFSAENAVQGNTIIAQLQKAGALVVTPTIRGDLVELRYEALIRHWKRLHDWIDERAKFRDAALFWVRTGKNKGALLNSRELRKSGSEYSDLNELEQEFLAASYSYARGRLIVIAVAAVVFWIGLGAAPYIYTKFFFQRNVDTSLADARSSEKTNEARVAAIQWLAEHNQKLNLPGISLVGAPEKPVDLRKLVASRSQFMNATLHNVNFAGAKLPYARFDDATLCDMSFAEADLSGSWFSRARLGRMDFSRADLDGALFQDVTYDADDAPKFKGTAWWLAGGWNLGQVDRFAREFGVTDPNLPGLSKKLERFETALNGTPNGTFERAIALDRKAWTLATYGIQFDLAEKTAKEALETIRGLRNISVERRDATEPLLEDTLGYILMLEGDANSALTYLQPAAEAAAQTQNPAAIFRYAVALHMSGQDDQAVTQLTISIDAGYLPSHELLLLRKYFTGNFGKLLEEKLSQRRVQKAGDQPQSKAPPASPCPAPGERPRQ